VLTILLLFSFFWTSQVMKNTVHVTSSGTFATWYFFAGTPEGVPSNPTFHSLRRAVTTSFGSICFGSLIVAVIQTLKAIFHMIRNNSNENIVIRMLGLFAECILGFLDQLAQYFNLYAFVQVAIYGKNYIEAAKSVWRLLHTHGYEAIVNDNLIDNVLTLGTLLGALLTATCGGVAAVIVDISDYWIHMAILGFFVGVIMMSLVMSIVESGVATIFVCFAEEPATMQRNNPYLYEKFRSTYDQVCDMF